MYVCRRLIYGYGRISAGQPLKPCQYRKVLHHDLSQATVAYSVCVVVQLVAADTRLFSRHTRLLNALADVNLQNWTLNLIGFLCKCVKTPHATTFFCKNIEERAVKNNQQARVGKSLETAAHEIRQRT